MAVGVAACSLFAGTRKFYASIVRLLAMPYLQVRLVNTIYKVSRFLNPEGVNDHVQFFVLWFDVSFTTHRHLEILNFVI